MRSRDEEKTALALYQGNRVLAEAIRMRDWHGLDIKPVLGKEVATSALTNLGSAVGYPHPDDPGRGHLDWPHHPGQSPDQRPHSLSGLPWR